MSVSKISTIFEFSPLSPEHAAARLLSHRGHIKSAKTASLAHFFVNQRTLPIQTMHSPANHRLGGPILLNHTRLRFFPFPLQPIKLGSRSDYDVANI